MKKVLIIIANPKKSSFSHAIGSSYYDGVNASGGECEIIDLYDLDQGFLRFDSPKDLKKSAAQQGDQHPQKIIQKKINESDELVFIFPVRWGFLPAILKNFFDVTFASGFAFEFVAGKSTPKKLLVGKKAKVYTHCDAPSILYKTALFGGINLKRYLKNFILGFCGIYLSEYRIFGKLRASSLEKRQKFLASITKSASSD